MPVPTEQELGRLAPFERWAFELVRRLSRDLPKSLTTAYLHHVGANWIHFCTRNLIHIDGLERLRGRIRFDDRILLVANHRSFFDLYILMTELYQRLGLAHRLYFPVRADFFYERPLGLLINAVVGGFAMYPPVFRQPEKRAFNRYALDEAIALLRTPGVLMGFHPEGTRNKGPDPYCFLPAQPGVGEVCYKSRPLVIPAFVLGLSNDFVRQVASNFTRTGAPIILVLGEPLDLESFYRQSPRLATYKRLSDHLMEHIGRLAERERELRARLTS